MQAAIDYAKTKYDSYVNELEDLLRIPSISADPAYADDVQRTAEWLVEHFLQIGMHSAKAMPTAGHPIVFAEYIEDTSVPTILVYGHYDVQPPDPIELWKSPPFEPVVKNGDLYARGASDDKGQTFMHIKAVEAYIQAEGHLPVNIKFIIEGEEECGSANLTPFIDLNKELLTADIVVVSDTALFAEDVPSITSALRGMAYCEVTLTGPDRDLHSGVYGGAIENPINALSRLISNLHDKNHRITIPGFYDKVIDLTEVVRDTFRKLPHNNDEWMASVGVKAVRTEKGYSSLEATTARPTLDVNGIWGGYTGEGAKTVLPAKASAKISMRLVADQDPHEIAAKLRAYFEANLPPTMQLEFRELHGGKPVLVDTKSPAMRAVFEAMEAVYNKVPYFTREGGSIPVVGDFKEILGIDTVLMGFGLNTDAIHSPNEHFALDRFKKGIEASIRFMSVYAEQNPR